MRKALQDLELKAPSVVILEAGKDELVPKEHGNVLERRCQNLGVNVKKVTVGGALHTEITAKPKGRRAIVEAIENSTTASRIT
ncbi:uncharacterized protein RSE6_07260 [Rhynchosporium secalis]|uniref:Peptidase S9 prolyl oligopeptidase catalytic domain-containing protein n=1 Tax=Rhynchosporium secalis TaxID=38038 RepID=A0A1E1MCD0_RHYSE|nr:uncharacterized protein RSE6_07260 [Rhynchosporium secalis]